MCIRDRRNYSPIRSMISRLEMVFEEKEKDTQEIPYIENSMNQLIRHMQQDRKEIQERQELCLLYTSACTSMPRLTADICVTAAYSVMILASRIP